MSLPEVVSVDSDDCSSESTTSVESGENFFTTNELVDIIQNGYGLDTNQTPIVAGFKPERRQLFSVSMPRVNLELDQGTGNGDPDSEAFIATSNSKRQRKRKGKKCDWKREVNKAKRMHGEEYVGFTGGICETTGRKLCRTGALRAARKMGPPCRSTVCIKRDFSCSDFTEPIRTEIFNDYWKLEWGEKKTFVTSLIDKQTCKRKRARDSTRRMETNTYFLKLNERKVRVCRRFFESTLGISKNTVAQWTNNLNKKSDSPKRKPPRPISAAGNHASLFLDNVPKLPSHYSRMYFTKLYLEPEINSKNELFELYQKYCEDKGYPSVSRYTLNRLVESKNIGVFRPRKDTCDICDSYKTKQVSEEDFKSHLNRKDLAQQQKRVDKNDALDGKCHVITMDLQAVKLSPMLKTSSLYYKTKLMVHNFTLYNLKTNEAVCYWWNETEGNLTASVFASCVVDYINCYLQDQLPLIIYSDGCGYQNRNVMMSNALLDLAIRQEREIIQKYLEKGHTYMECDSVHSAIEAELKNKPIYVPTDYLTITQNARTKQPYIIRHLHHDFFKNYSLKEQQRYLSIRPGQTVGDPVVTDLKNIRYSSNGKIYYKLDYSDKEWTELSKRRGIENVDYPRLFQERLTINARKYKDLQELKLVIPLEYHQFYDNIPKDN